MMHDIMEDYVYDLLANYRTKDQHWKVLERVFERLLNHNIILNPKKYIFGITSGKLLGFIISKRGLEVDPKKVTAIMSMPLPHNVKTLRSLQGKIQAIRRFIAQLSYKCKPFNELLKKDIQFKWSESYQ